MPRFILLVLAAVALVAVGCGEDAADGSDGAKPAPETATPAAQTTTKVDEKAPDRRAAAAKRGTTVKVVDSQFGRVIADRRGEALYLFDREKGKRSRCYGDCAVAWPPLLTKGKPRAGKGAEADLLGTTRRRDGKLQVTYNGHPVYYYVEDAPGRILCHNVEEFGGLWLVVNPRGDAVA